MNYLYRYFDADGELLYLGVTAYPDKRDAAHGSTTWHKVATRREVFAVGEDRTVAEAMERAAIMLEQPRHNVAGKRRHFDYPTTDVDDDVNMTPAEVAKVFGVTPRSVRRWLSGMVEGVNYSRMPNGLQIRRSAVDVWLRGGAA